MENKVVTLKINSDFGSAEADLKSLGIAVKNVDKEATNLDATFEEIYGDLKPLTARMGEAEDRLYELAKAGKQSSQEYKDLLKSVGEYKRVQQQTDLVVDAAAQTMGSKLTGSLNAAAGGFSLAQGSMALFGSESSSVEAAMLKVQSAMAISQGFETINQSTNSIKQLGEVLKNTTVIQRILTVATTAYVFVTEAASIGMKIFRAALLGTGIGAIVVGLGLLIANFDKVKNAVMNVIPGLKSVGDFFGSIVNAVTDFVGATSDATRALDKLKEDAENTLKVNKKFMTEHGDQLDEYTKRKIDAKNAYAEALKEDGANQIELAKRLNRELAKADADRQAEKDKKAKEIKDKENEIADAQRKKDLENLKNSLNAQRDAIQNNINEVTQALSDSQDKESEFLGTAQEAEEQKIKDKYFRLLELAKQQGRSKDEIQTLEIARENELNDVRLINQQKQYDAEKKIEEAKLEQKKAIKKAEEDLLMSALSSAKSIFSQNKAIQKGVLLAENGIALAKLTMNTIEAVGKDNAASPLTFGMPWSGVHIGQGVLGAANIISATSKGLAALGGGSAGSAPSMGSVQGGATTAPQFNVVGNSGANQLAQTLGREQPPIKAYVTAGDVTTGQSLNRNIITNASLG